MDEAGSDDVKRLGRAILFVHQHQQKITNPLIKAKIEILLLTGRSMDFAARLRGHHRFVPLTGELVQRYASFAGLGALELTSTVLPALKAIGIIDYALAPNGSITSADEYVGVTATVTEQTVQLLRQLNPTAADLAFLHSVEIGAMAPLARSQHLNEVAARGFTAQQAELALQLSRAVGINQEVPSVELNEAVVFSPYVWGTKQISLAKFLNELPPGERGALLRMSEQFLHTPGIATNRLSASPALIRGARNAGLIQAATVQSAAGRQSTYAFSPLLEMEDDALATTEALHHRKLFTAHILFGHENAAVGFGKILDPAALVNSLVNRGIVGPATNIGTDYHLLEMAGIVAVEPMTGGDRAFLRLIKPEIAEASLNWLRRITDATGAEQIQLAEPPSAFGSPEDSREPLTQSAGEATEIMVSSVNELRKELQRATRQDDPWS